MRDRTMANWKNARRGWVCQVETVPCAGRWDWKTVGRIRELVKAHGVDVLHTHGYKADVYGCAAAWPHRVALVATCHNWPSRLPSMRAYAAIDRLALRHFDRVATASGPVAEILSRWKVPAHKLKTIPNGVDMEPFRGPRANRRRHCASNSGPAPPAGGLRGATGARQRGRPYCCPRRRPCSPCFRTRSSCLPAMVRPAPNGKRWPRSLGIASKVVFAGKRDDMPAVYAALDIVVAALLPGSHAHVSARSAGRGKTGGRHSGRRSPAGNRSGSDWIALRTWRRQRSVDGYTSAAPRSGTGARPGEPRARARRAAFRRRGSGPELHRLISRGITATMPAGGSSRPRGSGAVHDRRATR